MKRIKNPPLPVFRFNPSEQAMEHLQDARLTTDEAAMRYNLVVAGRTIATALQGSGLVVDMSDTPEQIAEIQIPSGFVIGVPVASFSY